MTFNRTTTRYENYVLQVLQLIIKNRQYFLSINTSQGYTRGKIILIARLFIYSPLKKPLSYNNRHKHTIYGIVFAFSIGR